MTEKRRMISPCLILLIGVLTTAQALSAAEKSKNKLFGEPREDQALVYLIRKGRFAGSARTMFVYAEDQLLGVLDNSSYTFVYLDPGTHLFWTNWTRNRKEIDLVPQKVFYFEAWSGFEPLEPTEGQALIKKVKFHTTLLPKELRTAEKQIRERYSKALRKEEKMGKAEIAFIETMEEPTDTTGYLKIPAYTEITLELMENVTSYMNPTGNSVWFRTSSDILIEGRPVIAEGTLVQATVRHSAKGVAEGIGGNFDLVVPSASAIDNSDVPLLGRIESTGRRKTGAATAAALGTAVVSSLATGGLAAIAMAFPRGKEAFLLVGEEFTVWTKGDHWVPTGPSAYTKPTEQRAPQQSISEIALEGQMSTPVNFTPEKRRTPSDILLGVKSELAIQSAEIREIHGWQLPEPVKPRSIILKNGEWMISFSGWDVIRYARLTSTETPIAVSLSGMLADGSAFAVNTQVPIRLKAKGLKGER